MTNAELDALNLPHQEVVETGNGVINNAGILTKTGWRIQKRSGTNSDNTLLYNKFTDGTNTVFTASERTADTDAGGNSYTPWAFYRDI